MIPILLLIDFDADRCRLILMLFDADATTSNQELLSVYRPILVAADATISIQEIIGIPILVFILAVPMTPSFLLILLLYILSLDEYILHLTRPTFVKTRPSKE